jgi:hypothetical protein
MDYLLPTINGFDFALIAIIFGMFLAILSMGSTISRLRYQRDDWRRMCLDTAKELKEYNTELFKVKMEKGLDNIITKGGHNATDRKVHN